MVKKYCTNKAVRSEGLLRAIVHHFLWSGQDASAAFEDVGHSPEARALTDQYRIGTVAGGHAKLPKDIAVAAPPENTR